MILTGFFVVPRGAFTLGVVIDGNGRSAREAGNDGFRIASGRTGGCRGEAGEASGDDTRGRVVLTASDMIDSESIGCDWYKEVMRSEE
jgi:hypothetical protein